jgi:xylulokinase
MFESLQRFLKQYPVKEVTIVGGGGASDIWCQIFSDVMNVRIRQIESCLQANVMGSAFIAGVGIGAIQFSDISQLNRTKRIYEPNPDHQPVYDAAYGAFREVYQRLAPFFGDLTRLVREADCEQTRH